MTRAPHSACERDACDDGACKRLRRWLLLRALRLLLIVELSLSPPWFELLPCKARPGSAQSPGVRTARRDGAGITKAVSCQERCDIGHNIRRGLWLAAWPSISAPGSCRNDLFDHLVGTGNQRG